MDIASIKIYNYNAVGQTARGVKNVNLYISDIAIPNGIVNASSLREWLVGSIIVNQVCNMSHLTLICNWHLAALNHSLHQQ